MHQSRFSLVLNKLAEMGDNTWVRPISILEHMDGPYSVCEKAGELIYHSGKKCMLFQAEALKLMRLSYFLVSCLGHTCKDNVITICIATSVTMCGMDITTYSQHARVPARVSRDIRHQSR